MPNTKFNVDALLRRLAAKNNQDYDKQFVAEAAGISRATITTITNNTSKRIDLETIDKLLDFFASEGMPVSVGDLFAVATSPGGTSSQPPAAE